MRDTRRTRVILGVLLVAALTMITIDHRGGDDSPLRGLRGLGAAMFGPVERASAAIVRPVGNTFDAITDAPGQRRRAEKFARQNQLLREKLRAAQLDKAHAAQLRRLLGTAGRGGYKIAAARVVSAGHGYEDTVTIDVGSRSGIEPDMTVMDAQGLVGRVTRVGPGTSTVLLATDQTSSVGARLEDSKEIGILQGQGRHGRGADESPLRFQLLNAAAPVKAGQRIVTFGSQGQRPYVPGVPVGVVERVEKSTGGLTRTAYVRPFVRYSALDVVAVVVAPPKTDPRDSVLPPKPTPTPTPTPTPSRTPSPSGTPSPGSSPLGGTEARPSGERSPSPQPSSGE